MLNKNVVYCMDNREGMAHIPDKSVDLIFADPPYYRVKGDFDFIFKSFTEYLEFMEGQAKEYKRILKDSGSIILYGDSQNIAYIQVIYDKYFYLLNNAVWYKGKFMNLEHSSELRSLAPCTERILFYSQDDINTTNCIKAARDYMRAEIIKARGKLVLKEINEALGTATNGGGVASSVFSENKEVPTMITPEIYEKLQAWLGPDYLQKPYGDLRSEYEAQRRYFNNVHKITEVITVTNDANNNRKYDHDTVKPKKLTRILLDTVARPGALCCIPFSGSGTEAETCIEMNIDFYAFEIEQRWADMSNGRVSEAKDKKNNNPTLFEI